MNAANTNSIKCLPGLFWGRPAPAGGEAASGGALMPDPKFRNIICAGGPAPAGGGAASGGAPRAGPGAAVPGAHARAHRRQPALPAVDHRHVLRAETMPPVACQADAALNMFAST